MRRVELGDRHLVRQRRDALRPVPLPLRGQGGVRGALPGRLHLRGPGPDPRLVLHAARRVDPALRPVELPQLRLPRADPRPRGPEDVEEPRQRGRPLGRARRPRRRRLPLVLPDHPAALVRVPLLAGDGRRVGPPVHAARSGTPTRSGCSTRTPRGSTPEDLPTAPADLTDLDRWALSRLQATVATVRERMDDFDCTTAGRAIADFVEELSNWYVRLSRGALLGGRPGRLRDPAHLPARDEQDARPVHPLPRRRDLPQPGGRRRRRVRRGATTRSTCADFPEVDEARRDPDLEAAMAAVQRHRPPRPRRPRAPPR